MLEQLRRRRACRNVPTEAAAEKVPRTSRQPARPCRQLFCTRDLVHHPKRIGTQLVPRRCTRGEFYHDAAHAPDVCFPAVVVVFQHLWSHPRCSPTAAAVTHWPSGASVAKASHAKAQNDGQRDARAASIAATGAGRNTQRSCKCPHRACRSWWRMRSSRRGPSRTWPRECAAAANAVPNGHDDIRAR